MFFRLPLQHILHGTGLPETNEYIPHFNHVNPSARKATIDVMIFSSVAANRSEAKITLKKWLG